MPRRDRVDEVVDRLLPCDPLSPMGQAEEHFRSGLVTLDVRDEMGGKTTVGVSIRRELVEIRHEGRLHAVFDRDALREWLRAPHDWLMQDDALWVGTGMYVAFGILGVVPVEGLTTTAITQLRTAV